ncbi:hydroxycarboxylic acid receptor 2-like [Chanos chanos]|uniref:Hydroxycarboxylic acid receptor 2-like n=1 Tax=Chanos chanos TaxID=29144 RepID=A0A6J2UX37_CHACN|nr:hydroxycarboxylic acid receptor 2-like [Chanos chanos]
MRKQRRPFLKSNCRTQVHTAGLSHLRFLDVRRARCWIVAMENTTCCAFESPILDQVLPPILVLEFMFGLLGNFVALSMFIFYMDAWRPNSIYLTHLAVADSVVLFCLPFRADYYRRGKNWIYGDALCRILLFLLAANRAAGIFFLTAVAVDRYLKIVHPLNRINRMGLSYALWVSCGLWCLIVAMTAYLLTEEHFFFRNNRTQCESFNICMGSNPLSNWHNAFYVIQFFLPTSIVIFCTTCISWQLKSKTVDTQGKIKRAVQFVFAVALVFITCFFPSTISRVAVWVLKAWYNECSYFREANLAFYTSVCFTYFNSVLNPLVYYFSSPAFSGTFQKLFQRLLGRKTDEDTPHTDRNRSVGTESGGF